MNSGRNIVRLAASVIAAGIVGACARDEGVARVAGPLSQVREGARIQGRLTRTIQRLGPIGEVQAESITTSLLDAQVSGGSARTEGGQGPLVALSGTRTAVEPASFTDSAGHVHRIVIEDKGADGEPPRAVRGEVDGHPLARVEYRWRRAGKIFLLSERTTTIFGPDGKPAAREKLVSNVEKLLDGPATAFQPSVMLDCVPEFIYYAFASLGLVAATENLVARPASISSWVAFGAAVKFWDGAFDTFVDCMLG